MFATRRLKAGLLSFLFLSSISVADMRASGNAQSIRRSKVQGSYERTELYFGRSMPRGGQVSDREWEKFLADVATARFPDGFTVVPAQGQYRGRERLIVKEQSELLIFIYPSSRRLSISRKIEEIRRAYVRQFMQESVLRVDVGGLRVRS